MVDSLGLEKFALLGVSQGGSVGVAYASRHPERVSQLVLYGAYALGWAKRSQDPGSIKTREAMSNLIGLGWGQANPAFRQMFTSLFIPEAGPEQMRWYNELQRVSCTPENAARFDSVFSTVDVTQLLKKISVPTLVLHARHDSVVPFEQGRLLATQIPKARFVPFESRNHILLENEPGWQTFLAELRLFLGGPAHPATILEGPKTEQQIVDDPHATRDLIIRVEDVPLSRFRVVGSYVRHDPQVRNSLKDWKLRIISDVQTHKTGTSNYLLWAPPGSGKTYFVQEIARSLGDLVRYEELNLAQLGKEEFVSRLRQLDASTKPSLCLVDEIDAKPAETWPYETLLSALDPTAGRTSTSFILAGSSTSGIDQMKRRIASRPKGGDVLSRIPVTNEFVIPSLSPGDRILVSLAQLRHAGRGMGRTVNEVEKLALYYICSNPRLSNARQLRSFAARSVERLPIGEDRIKYDHLFAAGDPENKGFWTKSEPVRKELAGSFISISD